MERVLRTAGIYLLVQAFAVAGWWIVLVAHPPARMPFRLGGAGEEALLAFWFPDLVLLAAGSAGAGLLVLLRHALAPTAAAAVAGAALYATLYCVAGALLTDGGWWSVAAMLPAGLLSSVFAVAVNPVARAYMRAAAPRPAAANLARTGVQIAVFWSVLLVVVPVLLVRLESELGVPRARAGAPVVLGAAAFLGASLLGLWSAWTMAGRGEGTPLPLDSTRRLVMSGPYAHVRNPMAMAGLAQGMAVALVAGSATVAAYALLGTALWQGVARPIEEDDLARRFGGAYDRYRREVRCWIPRRRPYADTTRTARAP
jgi:protein-S-isoprenylcysteine O-methyltransferase Ste14